MGEMGIIQNFSRKTEGKMSLVSPRRRWTGNKMDVKETGCEIWTGSSGSGYCPTASFYEHGNELYFTS
jgi:hypothetical protein